MKIAVLLIMVLPVLSAFSNQAVTTNADSTAFLGLSGYPTSTAQIDNIINLMDSKGLNTYRMCFSPAWTGYERHAYDSSYVQFFLDHSIYTVIVDRNHLYPPTEESASTARSNWSIVKASVFEVLEAFPNNSRVMVELINEYISSDFYSRMQSLVDEIRDAGYTNPIVINKWSQPWAVVYDPLNNIYQSYHYYFCSWSVSGAVSNVKTALSKGIKLINTEVGADYEYPDYTVSTVDELNSFMAQCVSLGVGNTVWVNENLMNWPHYQELGLDFPTASPPTPPPAPHPTSILFEDGFESGSFSVWSGTGVTSGETTSISTALVQNGTYGARFTSNGDGGYEKAYAYKDIPASSELYARGSFYVSQSGLFEVNDRFFYLIFASGSNNLAYAGIRQTSSGTRWCLTTRQGTGYVDIYSSSAPSTGRWYSIELHWVKNSVNGLVEMWVDGTRVCVSTGTNTATYGDATQLKAGIAESYNLGSATVYADSIQISQSSLTSAQYSLLVEVSGSGSTNPTGDASYVAGTVVSVAATPSSGWLFDHWLLDDNNIGSTNPYAVTMNSDHDLVAEFTEIPPEEIPSILFEDGFESGSFSVWSGTSRTSGEASTVSSSRDHHDTRSAYFTSNGGGGTESTYAYESVEATPSLYARGYFYISTSGARDTNDRFQLLAFRAGSTSVAYAGWYRTSSGLRWFLSVRSGSSTVTAYSTAAPATGQWYSVELHWIKGSTDGLGELWVNGAKVASLTNRNTAYYGDVTSVRYGLPQLYSCRSTYVYLDCVRIGENYLGPE